MYSPSAILIPPPADSFVVGHVAITKFFQEGASTIKQPVLTPLVVQPERERPCRTRSAT